MPHPDLEAAPELETIALFEKLGYTTANCYSEWNSGTSNLRCYPADTTDNPPPGKGVIQHIC